MPFVLAKELGADIVLLDDYDARSLAKGEGLEVLGTLGVLETARRRGCLADARLAFTQVTDNSYIDKRRLNERLRAMALAPL